MQKEDIKKTVAKGKQKLSEEAAVLQQSVKEVETNVEEKLEKAWDHMEPVIEEAKEKVAHEAAEIAKQKPSRRKKADVVIQSLMGGEITVPEIEKRVKEAAGAVDHIYIKTEENRIYYSKGEETGSIEIWD